MLRRTPLALLLLAGSVFPLSCSETPTDSDAGTGGSGAGTGGGLTVDGSTGGQGLGGEGADGNTQACGTFQGLGDQCGLDQLSAETTPVNILLVLDKSGSMDKAPDGSSSTTLWEAVNTALESALSDASPAVSFGMQLFPGRTVIPDCDADDCCSISGTEVDVPVAAGDEPRAEILDLLGRTQPGGGTPTAEALARAHHYFTAGPGAELEGGKFVLLATDGGPNCNAENSCDADACTLNIDGNCNVDPTNCCATTPTGCLDDDNVLAMIEQLYQAGVDTFVVGLAGTEEYAEQLDAFAEAGGRAREGAAESYYKVAASGSAAGLTDVLNDITRQLVQQCDIELAPGQLDLNKLNVAVDCAIVPYSTPEEAGGGGAGGESSEDPYEGPSFWWIDGIDVGEIPTVHLGGEICGIIKTQGVERIDILRGCQTVK